MTTQPEALKLADVLEDPWEIDYITRDQAAAELRRLHSLNAELLGALEIGVGETEDYLKRNNLVGLDNQWLVMARAAIDKAKE